MRKLNHGLLTVVLAILFSLCSFCAAYAASANYKSTQSFIDELEKEKIKYTLVGTTESNHNELVEVSYTTDNFNSLKVRLFFDPDGDIVSLRIWDIVIVSAGKNFALDVINKLNVDYKFIKFYLESDNTITGSMDMYIDPTNGGEAVRKAMQIMIVGIDREDIAKQLKSLESSPSTEPTSNQEITATCNTNKVNVRTEPDGSRSIGQINKGDKVTVLETQGEWSRINCKHGEGWVKTKFLQ